MRKKRLVLEFLSFSLAFVLFGCNNQILSSNYDNNVEKSSITEYEKLFSKAPHLAYDEYGMGGYIDKKGEWVISPQYLQVGTFYDGLAAVKDFETGLWGYIDTYGNMVIEPRFEVVGDFHDGTSVVKVTPDEMQDSERYGIINKKGEYILKPYYSSVSNFYDDYALTYYNWTNEYWFLNRNGEEALGPFDFASIFNHGRAIVQKNGQYYIIDKEGNRYNFTIDVVGLGSPVYYNISHRLWDDGDRIDQKYDFLEGVPVESSNTGMALANIDGEIISPYYHYIFPFRGEYASARIMQDGRLWYGFVDREFNWVIQPQFYGASNFYDGKAWVETGEMRTDWAIIDESGSILSIKEEHDGITVDKYDAIRTSNGVPIPAYKDQGNGNSERKGGYIDWNYNEIIPFQFDEVKTFAKDGSYAVVKENGLYGMIDGKGAWLIMPKFSQLTEKL
jgi:KWG leptospira repeat protein